MVATRLAGRTVGVRDLFAAMVLLHAEKLARFWDTEAAFAVFAQTFCGLTEDRTVYWDRYASAKRGGLFGGRA